MEFRRGMLHNEWRLTSEQTKWLRMAQKITKQPLPKSVKPFRGELAMPATKESGGAAPARGAHG